MITIRNNFHGSKVTIRANISDTLTPNQVRRARRELCGIDDCACGGALGERGEQDSRMFFTELQDGRVEVQTDEWYTGP